MVGLRSGWFSWGGLEFGALPSEEGQEPQEYYGFYSTPCLQEWQLIARREGDTEGECYRT